MQLQWKVVLLVGLLVAGVVAAVTGMTTQKMREEKTALFTANAEAQLAPVRRLVQAKLDLGKEQLIQFTRRKESGGAAMGAFGAYDVIALQFDQGNGRWDSKWVEKRVEAAAQKFSGTKEKTILASLPYAKVRDGSVHWVWRLDKKEGAMFILMVPVQIEAPQPQAEAALPEAPTENKPAPVRRGIVVGIFAGNPLAVVTEDFVSALNTVYVVDDAGYVASHSRKSYTGSNFSEDDVVKEIKSSAGRNSRSGTYENLDGERVYGRWEKVEGSNLHAVIATPTQVVAGSSVGITKTMTWLGIAGTVFAMLLAFAISRFFGNAAPQPAPAPLAAAGSNSGIIFTDSPDDSEMPMFENTEPSTQVGPPPTSDRKPAENVSAASAPPSEAYKQMALGLSKELRKPLAALLGHVQLLKGKTSGETARHSESIEAEARQLRDVVDALSGMTGVEGMELKPTALQEIVAIAASNLEKEFGVAKVQVKLETERAPLVNASPVHLQKAIEALCRQAIESMRTRPGKELRIRVYDTNDGRVRLQIRDAGIGIDRDQADRYFEPFFQPYEGAPNLGMNLSMAQSILERHEASPSVDSVPGTGTIVTADFPVSATQTAQAPSFEPPPAMPNVPTAPPLPEAVRAQIPPVPTPAPAKKQSEPEVPQVASVKPPTPPPKAAAPVPTPPALEQPPALDSNPRFEISQEEVSLANMNFTPPALDADSSAANESEAAPPALELEAAPEESASPESYAMPEEPAGLNFTSLTLGGRAPIKEEKGLPPTPPLEGMSGVAFDLKLVDADQPAPRPEEKPFADNLPPMDLSRTAPPPEGMRELALPTEGAPILEDDEVDAFAQVNLKTDQTEIGTAVNFGDLSQDSAVTASPTTRDDGAGDGFKVKIRRPKKG